MMMLFERRDLKIGTAFGGMLFILSFMTFGSSIQELLVEYTHRHKHFDAILLMKLGK
jgi:hypothetical protein